MVQVQVRLPKEMVKNLDKKIKENKYKSRSDAIRTILAKYEEKEKTQEFYKMLAKRSKQADDQDILIPLEE